MSAAIDAMVLMWAMRALSTARPKSATDDDLALQQRAWMLLEMLHDEKRQIVVPTVAVAELLAGIPHAQHGQFVAEMQQRFFMPPFDIRAASVSAKLWQDHRGLPKADQLSRSVLKADALIIATAKVAGATDFYSHERKARRLAELAGLSGKDLPVHTGNFLHELEWKERLEAARKAGT
ncbi:MAG TPA: PIN domain-containing protein [Pirellulales bacterium]|nr:PIN domain-containing protein [Pirellulales bacterium]